jgi:hypothetical protein
MTSNLALAVGRLRSWQRLRGGGFVESRKRLPAYLRRITDAGLRNFYDFLGDDFGSRIRVVKLQNAQTILICGHHELDALRAKRRLLQ